MVFRAERVEESGRAGKMGSTGRRNWENVGAKWRRERGGILGGRWRKWSKVWRGGGRGGDAEVGSGACRLSGVCYLWSKCTLAFLLSTPQMQLDSLLAKQTQMKWLLNDFLSNPPRQHKPSIWSLLFPSLSPLVCSPSFFKYHFHISYFDSSCQFSCVFLFDLLFLWSPLASIFSCVNPFSLHLFSCLHSCLFSWSFLPPTVLSTSSLEKN